MVMRSVLCRSPFTSLQLVAFLALLPMPGEAQEGEEDKSVVAVLRYDNNTGDEKYDHLGRALSSMMISDLSVLDQIRLVERERLEELLDELDLQQSAYVDPESAQSVGMIIGAQYVVFGAFVSADPEMRLDTRIARAETSEIVTTAEVTGQQESLFDLQQRLADELVEGFGLVLTEEERARLRAQQEANRIDDMETMLLYARVLCLLDNEAYPEALESAQDLERRALVGATLGLVRNRAEDEARNRVADEARSRLGGLLGRSREPERRPTGC
jgi:TolB-like protein